MKSYGELKIAGPPPVEKPRINLTDYKAGQIIHTEKSTLPKYISGDDPSSFIIEEAEQPEVITANCPKCAFPLRFMSEKNGLMTYSCDKCGKLWGKV